MFGAAFGVAVQPVPVRPVDDALDSPQLTLVITFLIAGNKRRGEQRCARECAAKRTYLTILTELLYSCTFHTRS